MGTAGLEAQYIGAEAMRNTTISIMARLRRTTARSLVGFLAFAMLTFGQVATAAAQVVITQVFVDDPLPNQVTIDGSNFDNGPGLDVTLGNFAAPLNIVNAAPNQIIVDLPAGLTAGDYLLSVTTGGGRNRQDGYNLTIGAAAGPVGDVPIGAIILWDQSNACPAGFAHVAAFDDRFLVAGNVPGTTGGANQHAHGAGTLTGPAHQHDLVPWDQSVGPVDDNSGGTDFNARTDLAGGGTVTGTSASADGRPPFMTILLCRRII